MKRARLVILCVISLLAVVNEIECQDNNGLFTLSGRVFERGSTTTVVPVVGIKAINVRGKEFTAISRVNGSYELRLPFGKYKIEFSRACFKITVVANYENISTVNPELNVGLERGHCDDCGWNICDERLLNLSGGVRDQYGGAIPNVKLKLSGETISGHKLELSAKTDDEGRYYFDLPRGKYKIKAQASGHNEMKSKKIMIDHSDDLDIELIAKPTPIIK